MAKTNSGLVAYAKAKVGCYYWFGCFGQMASKALYTAKKKQYPKYYTASDFEKQIKNPKQVFDCAGLIKAYLWTDSISDTTPTYNASQDYSANTFYTVAKTKGTIKTFKKQDGLLVFKGSSSKKTHIGVYAGGYVYEAKGHAYGVVKTKFDSSWTYWAQCHLLKDDTDVKPGGDTYMVEVRTLKYIKGNTMKGEDVKSVQAIVGAKQDGSFGPDTEKCVKAWQKAHGLTDDGSFGPKSWNKAVGCK